MERVWSLLYRKLAYTQLGEYFYAPSIKYGCVITSSGNISADQMFMMSNLCLLPSNHMICANITSAILGL